MTTPSRRRQVAEALAVRWTPALAARIERRIGEALGRRRRRRAVLIGLALLAAGGVSFAFTFGPRIFRRRPTTIATPVRIPARTTSAPKIAPAPAPHRVPDPALAPESSPERVPHRHLALVTPSKTAVSPPTVSSLFAEADAARLAGHPADAVAPLSAIFTRFPGDARASLAAFQLGRVLADEMRDPAAAARAFSLAHDLAPEGPLATDAATRADEARRAAARGSAQRP